MRARSRSRRRSGCPVSIALESLGDSWSLLVVRDLMFKGYRTFNEFLCSGEGIASNILADRLARLEEAGIITKASDPTDARRYRYRLTRKGIDLAPTLVELILWSTRYERTTATPAALRAMSGNRERYLAELRKRWRS